MRTGILIILLLCIQVGYAGVVINTTRVIFPGNQENTEIQLTNSGDMPSLVQSWVDEGDINSSPETSSAPFMVVPPVTRIAGSGGQQLKIRVLKNNLPRDRESVFYLNVVDIPAKTATTGNTLQFALRTRIKLFYRPAGLTANPETVIDNIQWKLNGDHLSVTNNSPYHFTIAAVNANDSSHTWLAASEMIPPFSEKQLPLKNKPAARNASVTYVDDYGVYKSKNITF